MRLVLIGAVESTRVALDGLRRAGAVPVSLVTLPLVRAARHSDFVDLRRAAGAMGVPVLESADVNAPELVERLREIGPDYLLVIGWSQLFEAPLRSVPSRGAIGYHPSLLPLDRGRGVIPWTILLRRQETGSSLFWLDDGADSGDLLAQERISVEPDETAASLYRKHMSALERLLAGAVLLLSQAAPPRLAQDHARATWCPKRTSEDGRISWEWDAEQVWTLIRASGRPYPGAFTLQGERRLVIWDAALVPEAPYHGSPGDVVARTSTGALIACGRGFVRVGTVSRGGAPDQPATTALELHERLGPIPETLATRLPT